MRFYSCKEPNSIYCKFPSKAYTAAILKWYSIFESTIDLHHRQLQLMLWNENQPWPSVWEQMSLVNFMSRKIDSCRNSNSKMKGGLFRKRTRKLVACCLWSLVNLMAERMCVWGCSLSRARKKHAHLGAENDSVSLTIRRASLLMGCHRQGSYCMSMSAG